MGVRNYRDLIARQKAMDLAEEIYNITRDFPQEEKYSLVSQSRRSATSIPSNIAVGEGRFSKPEFKRFLSIAHGSLREAETQIFLAVRLQYISQHNADHIFATASEVGRLIQGLAKSLSPS